MPRHYVVFGWETCMWGLGAEGRERGFFVCWFIEKFIGTLCVKIQFVFSTCRIVLLIALCARNWIIEFTFGINSIPGMHVSIPLEQLLVVFFFFVSTFFICLCVCKAEWIRLTVNRLKPIVIASKYRNSRPPAPSTIYAFVPRASYKRNWTPTVEDEESACARHSVPVWLQATTTPTEFCSSVYSFKHQYSVDSNTNIAGTGEPCYVTCV